MLFLKEDWKSSDEEDNMNNMDQDKNNDKNSERNSNDGGDSDFDSVSMTSKD